MGLNLGIPAVQPVAPTVEAEEKTAKQLEQERLEAEKNAAMAAANKLLEKKANPPKGVKVSPNLAQIMAETAKAKGPGIMMAAKEVPNVERLPTGIFELDLAIGGGFPKGRYSIVYGPESSTKTTLALLAIAQAQKLPPPCNKAVFIDAEHAFDPKWAAMCGVDVDALVVVKPGYGEEAGDIFEAVVRAEDVAVVVFDSLAVVVSTKEMEQSLEAFDVGTSSILIKRMVNKAIQALAEESRKLHFPAIILINQIRYKIGVMFGNPETTPGGKSKEFASSLTLRVSAKNKVVKSVTPDVHSFKETTVRVVKAKVPVLRADVEYDLCVYPHDGLGCGETNSWNTVSGYLKQMGALAKVPNKGWSLFGVTYPTLDTIQTEYLGDNDFRLKAQRVVIDSFKGEQTLVHGPQL